MAPVTFSFDVNRIAEAPHDASVIIIPTGPGPKMGVACKLRSASERNFKLALAGDHIMAANNVGPVAVCHTEAKPQGGIGGLNPREWRRLVGHMGSMLRGFDSRWIINRPGLPIDEYFFEGCIFTGDWGEERNSGSVPKTAGEFLITRAFLNGKDLLADPAEMVDIVAEINNLIP
ncbi:MAG: hypothetical protein IPM54_25040 [Polyangiaceae bacterium]|nr:hypothetical protein [Polyangiaceae bacterium]